MPDTSSLPDASPPGPMQWGLPVCALLAIALMLGATRMNVGGPSPSAKRMRRNGDIPRRSETFVLQDENGDVVGHPCNVTGDDPLELRRSAAQHLCDRFASQGISCRIERATHASETDDSGEDNFALVDVTGERFLLVRTSGRSSLRRNGASKASAATKRVRSNGSRLPRIDVGTDLEAGDTVRVRVGGKLKSAQVVRVTGGTGDGAAARVTVHLRRPGSSGVHEMTLSPSDLYQPSTDRSASRVEWTVYDENAVLVYSAKEQADGGEEYTIKLPGGEYRVVYHAPLTKGSRQQRDKRMVRALVYFGRQNNLKVERFQYGKLGGDGAVYDHAGRLLGHGA